MMYRSNIVCLHYISKYNYPLPIIHGRKPVLLSLMFHTFERTTYNPSDDFMPYFHICPTPSTTLTPLRYARAVFKFSPNQWETALLCNDVYHWLGASLESALYKTQATRFIKLYSLAIFKDYLTFVKDIVYLFCLGILHIQRRIKHVIKDLICNYNTSRRVSQMLALLATCWELTVDHSTLTEFLNIKRDIW